MRRSQVRLQNFVPVNRPLHAIRQGVNQDAKVTAMYEAADVKDGQSSISPEKRKHLCGRGTFIPAWASRKRMRRKDGSGDGRPPGIGRAARQQDAEFQDRPGLAPVPQSQVLRCRAEAQLLALILAGSSTSKSGLAIGQQPPWVVLSRSPTGSGRPWPVVDDCPPSGGQS